MKTVTTMRPITTDQEVAELFQMIAEIWREYMATVIGSEQVEYMLEVYQSEAAIKQQMSEGIEYFFIEKAGTPIGYTAYRLDEDALYISKLYLLAAYRGGGNASAVYQWLEEQARFAGKSCVRLNVNRDNELSMSVYRHWGLESVKEEEIPLGNGFAMVDYVFEKSL